MSTEKTRRSANTLEDLEAPIVDLTLDEAEAVEGGLLPARGIIAIAGDGSVMPTDPASFNYQKVKTPSSP